MSEPVTTPVQCVVSVVVDDETLEARRSWLSQFILTQGGMLPTDSVEIRILWNGSNHAGLNDLVQALGYSYMGSQRWLFQIACMGAVTWQDKPDSPFPNKQYPGKWPQSNFRLNRIPFGRFYSAEEWRAEETRRPHLSVCPKGTLENP